VEIQKGVKVANVQSLPATLSFAKESLSKTVFIGHNVTFINDRYPRSTMVPASCRRKRIWSCVPTRVRRGASIRSGATLCAGNDRLKMLWLGRPACDKDVPRARPWPAIRPGLLKARTKV